MADGCNEEPAVSSNHSTGRAPPPVATVVTTEPQRPSPLSEPSSDGLLGGGSDGILFESEKYGFHETVWGVGPDFPSAAGAGVPLGNWSVEIPGSDQFDPSFVDQWCEDAAM